MRSPNGIPRACPVVPGLRARIARHRPFFGPPTKVLLIATLTAMPSVSSMHEKVHHDAATQEQQRQCFDEVGLVFTDQQEAGDSPQDTQSDSRARAPEIGLSRSRTFIAIAFMIHNFLQT